MNERTDDDLVWELLARAYGLHYTDMIHPDKFTGDVLPEARAIVAAYRADCRVAAEACLARVRGGAR